MPLAPFERLDSIDEGSEDSSGESEQRDILALLRKKHNARPRSAGGASRPGPSREKLGSGRRDGEDFSGSDRELASQSARLSSQRPTTGDQQKTSQAARPSDDLLSSSLRKIEKQLPALHEIVSETRRELHDLREEMRKNGAANAESIDALGEKIDAMAEGQRAAQGAGEDVPRKEREELDALREKLIAEQEELEKSRRILEQDEALFEQRKTACREEIDFADRMMSSAKEAEARARLEMQRLTELGEYVTRKDAEADTKRAEATELWERIRKERATLQRDREEHMLQSDELAQTRTNLIKERIALLRTAGASGRGKVTSLVSI